MKNPMRKIRFDKPMTYAQKTFVLFLFGGAGYGLIEILWRGHTHPSMVLTGGTCLVLIREINRHFRPRPAIYRGFLCALTVTVVEFFVGCVVNKWLGLGVWDYSDMKFNVMGQVCLLYSIFWFCICVPAVLVLSACDKKRVKNETREKTEKIVSFSHKM